MTCYYHVSLCFLFFLLVTTIVFYIPKMIVLMTAQRVDAGVNSNLIKPNDHLGLTHKLVWDSLFSAAIS